MRIVTKACPKHASYRHIGGNAAHAYRAFVVGPARRCPRQASIFETFASMPPSIEMQTLDEVRRIRRLLEERSHS